MEVDMTLAERVAGMFDDGSHFDTDDGRTLRSACMEAGATEEWTPASLDPDSLVRWTFTDGSAITAGVGAWDLGYSDCWCWQGPGHADGCFARDDR